MYKISRLLVILSFSPQLVAIVLDEPPEMPDPEQQYVIYLHGGIVTGSDGRPTSSYFGIYEYRDILYQISGYGFTVISEIRDDDSELKKQVAHIVDWIKQLKNANVPGSNISVIGASMGGIIAGRVSNLIDDQEIKYVLIASMYNMKSIPPISLHGRVLTIYDQSDERDWVAEEYFARSPGLAARKVIVTDTGLGHGLLFIAHPAWVTPAVKWMKGEH